MEEKNKQKLLPSTLSVTSLGSVPMAMFEVRPSTFDVGCSVRRLWACGIRTSTIILGPQGFFLSKIKDCRLTALHLIRKSTFYFDGLFLFFSRIRFYGLFLYVWDCNSEPVRYQMKMIKIRECDFRLVYGNIIFCFVFFL